MFCVKCGAEISEDMKFCVNCGAEVAASEATTDAAAPASEEPAKPKKKRTALFVGLGVAVVAAVTGVVIWLATGKSAKASSYESEIRDYLDYIVDKNDDGVDYVTDTYVGGAFGGLYSGEEADKILEMMLDETLEQSKEEPDMGYSYGYSDEYYYDSWEEIFEELAQDFYNDMESVYGDWELEYKILEKEELSDSKIKRLQRGLKDILDSYDCENYDIQDKDVCDKCEDFVESLEELKVEKAYGVDVEIEIDGDEDSYDDTVTFVVAKIGAQWVIMDGPDFYELTNQ